MQRVGRNDPCPCGSGVKYKKCCLRRQARAGDFTADERTTALRKLGGYLEEVPAARVAEARAEFWGPYLERVGELDESLRLISESAFEPWLFFDYRLDDDRRLVEHFLETLPLLGFGERRYLAQAKSTCMRLYEVVEVRPGAGLTVRDVVNLDEIRVRELRGSRQMHRWDLLAARVMPVGASGEPEFDSGLFPLPRLTREDLLAMLEEDLEDFRRDLPGENDLELFEEEAPLFHQWWLRPALEPQIPDIVVLAPDGEKIPLPALADFNTEDSPQGGGEEWIESVPGEAGEMALEVLEKHYRAWLDEEIPALEGSTPRAAARSPRLRPRLVELLKDLEHGYEQTLSLGGAAYDPSWMWAELGLSTAATPRQRPPLTGFESMELQVEGIARVARDVAERFRRRQPRGRDISTTLTREALTADPPFSRFLRRQAVEAHAAGCDRQTAADHANLIATHLDYMCNFELHRRKTFWVEDSVAWLLGHTELDITGDLLRLPFASFAVIFTDRYTLGLAERILSLDPACELRGRMLKIVTAYVTEVPAESARGVRVAFTFDALAGQWPYLLTRDLCFGPDEPLEAILDSHFPDVDVESQDPFFSSAPLKRLLHLLINAILYATSADVEPELRPSPAPEPARKRTPSAEPFCSDEVYFLPGKIPISHLRDMQTVERAPSGRKLMHRFMVRGHWRRANPSWKDQRPRWIRPYWKGPEIAAVIERAYRMQP